VAKAERLLKRLQQMEGEYRDIAITACRAWLDGKFSKVAIRALQPRLLAGKLWRDEEAARFEWLEKEILALRLKLESPIEQSVVGKLRQLRAKVDGAAHSDQRNFVARFIETMSALSIQ
jgi:hypothetical protein